MISWRLRGANPLELVGVPLIMRGMGCGRDIPSRPCLLVHIPSFSRERIVGLISFVQKFCRSGELHVCDFAKSLGRGENLMAEHQSSTH